MAVKKVHYFRQVQEELKKVSWTSKEDLINATKAVLAGTFFFGFAIYGVDLLIRAVLKGLTLIVQSIGS